MKKILILASLLLVTIPAVTLLYIENYLNTPIGKDSIFLIRENSSFNQVIKKLSESGIVEKPHLFGKLLRKKLGRRPISYGEYEFLKNNSYRTIIDKIANHRIYYRNITFPEGLSNKSIFEILDNNEFLKGEISNRDNIMEGTLMPETYRYKYGDTRDSIIQRMQKEMDNFIDKNWEKLKNPYIKNKLDLITFASIVELETSIPSERRLIASVFVNRIRTKMRLQSDPTAIYGYAKGDKNKEKEMPRKSLIKYDSAHNTYKKRGLPPTPICNPGKDSIMAALEPANSDYFYFVMTGDRGHNFSKTFEEHRHQITLLRRRLYGVRTKK